MKPSNALAMIALSCALASLCAPACAADAAPSSDAVAQAAVIDDALLESRLAAAGAENGLRRTLAGKPQLDAIAACTHTQEQALFHAQFAASIASALSPDELAEGSRLATPVVASQLGDYVIANVTKLYAEANAQFVRDDDYFLTISAYRLHRADADRKAVAEFVAWHKKVGVRMDVAMRSEAQTRLLKEKATLIVRDCLMAHR